MEPSQWLRSKEEGEPLRGTTASPGSIECGEERRTDAVIELLPAGLWGKTKKPLPGDRKVM